jgi:hypothetical protein
MHYGFGFGVVVNYRGARRIDHGGGWLGYNCDLRLLPDQGGGVMVLTNRSDSGTAVLTNAILDDLLGLSRRFGWSACALPERRGANRQPRIARQGRKRAMAIPGQAMRYRITRTNTPTQLTAR